MEIQPNGDVLYKNHLEMAVTTGILVAERIEADLGRQHPDTAEAWTHVSEIEEGLVALENIDPIERDIAKRGAVAAAIKAGNHERASELQRAYNVTDEEVAP